MSLSESRQKLLRAMHKVTTLNRFGAKAAQERCLL